MKELLQAMVGGIFGLATGIKEVAFGICETAKDIWGVVFVLWGAILFMYPEVNFGVTGIMWLLLIPVIVGLMGLFSKSSE